MDQRCRLPARADSLFPTALRGTVQIPQTTYTSMKALEALRHLFCVRGRSRLDGARRVRDHGSGQNMHTMAAHAAGLTGHHVD